jgi:hypothetical protein
MYKSPEYHFHANPQELCKTDWVVLPISIIITQANATQALAEAKRITDAFDQALTRITLNVGQIAKLDFAQDYHEWKGKFSIQQVGKNDVKLTLSYGGVLTCPAETSFWSRAQSIVACLDGIQGFCNQQTPWQTG